MTVHCQLITESGLPHSEIPGSKPVRGSPRLIAAYHVLLRLSAPRHPPDTLLALDCSHNRKAGTVTSEQVSVITILALRFRKDHFASNTSGSPRGQAKGTRLVALHGRQRIFPPAVLANAPQKPAFRLSTECVSSSRCQIKDASRAPLRSLSPARGTYIPASLRKPSN